MTDTHDGPDGSEDLSGTDGTGGRDGSEREPLPGELRALGRAIRIPPLNAETMVERVLAELLAQARAERAQAEEGKPARKSDDERGERES
ncbi:hypothetical protein ACH429_24875 [Streptomyces pathocidini]|uniref:Uncharacterized protein n=1 Tax=Streptomyces pathocidini TaxID=1650571 RepID=A0ABW7UXK2_9ACTN|nr:hypothetical protein [Streptomyces pathocidini]